jgi:hypothetical protein
MNQPNVNCRYLDLLVRIAQNNPIPRVWMDARGGDAFTYNPNFGCYVNSRGVYLSSLLFESQMLKPNLWFVLGE